MQRPVVDIVDYNILEILSTLTIPLLVHIIYPNSKLLSILNDISSDSV